jgi:hypothetical protein
MAGAPEGNTNSSKDNRLWANTIRRAVAQSDGDRLRKIAEALLDKAAEGDISAIRELGDRLDGKAQQYVEQRTELSGGVEVSTRPQLTKEEWLAAHGLGTATRPAE